MPLILGIDPSLTATGLARIRVTETPIGPESVTPDEMLVATVGNKKAAAKTRREYSRRITSVVELVDAAMEDVDLIVMEELAYGAKGASAFVLPWLWGRIIDCAEARDVDIAFANVSQVKKYATGSGNAGKDQVIAKMIRAFPDVDITNDNEADALVLALIGCRGLGHPIDHPTQAKSEVMQKIGAPAHA